MQVNNNALKRQRVDNFLILRVLLNEPTSTFPPWNIWGKSLICKYLKNHRGLLKQRCHMIFMKSLSAAGYVIKNHARYKICTLTDSFKNAYNASGNGAWSFCFYWLESKSFFVLKQIRSQRVSRKCIARHIQSSFFFLLLQGHVIQVSFLTSLRAVLDNNILPLHREKMSLLWNRHGRPEGGVMGDSYPPGRPKIVCF